METKILFYAVFLFLSEKISRKNRYGRYEVPEQTGDV